MLKSLIKLHEIPAKSIILDCTWHFAAGFSGKQLYLDPGHIPQARFFDLDACVDNLSSYPHMLPSPKDFAAHMGSMGIKRTDTVVCYDGLGLFSAPRIWWMLKVFGHENVSVLDGGLKAWTKAGKPIEKGPGQPWEVQEYTGVSSRDNRMVIDYPQLLSSLNDFTATTPLTMLDARPAARFAGTAPEPRPIPSGHAPGSINVPYSELLSPDGTMLPKEELKKVFADKKIDLTGQHSLVTSCGSGVTAAIIYLALDVLGVQGVRLYDGS
ncbi:hypothetical protein HDU91_004303, partial [Kappamyces sp. JEL0680]